MNADSGHGEHGFRTSKGEGLMRRLDVGLDPIVMLDAALQEAAKAAGVELIVDNGAILITPSP